jgi:hypothetical protein
LYASFAGVSLRYTTCLCSVAPSALYGANPISFPKQKVTWLKKKLKDLNDFKNYSYLCPQEIKNLFNYHSLKQKHYG